MEAAPSPAQEAPAPSLMLGGQVSLGASAEEAPVLGVRLRSGRRLRLPTHIEVAPRTGDSEDEEEGLASDISWAPRIPRRGVPARRRISRENLGNAVSCKEQSPCKKAHLSPPPRIAPLALTRSGVSDLMSFLDVDNGATAPTESQVSAADTLVAG